MSIAIDAVTVDTSTSDRSSATFAHTCTGSDLVLFVSVTRFDASEAAKVITGITYDGVALTQIRTGSVVGFDDIDHDMWYLEDPSTGSNNVVVTFANVVISDICVAHSYTGADTSQNDEIDLDTSGTDIGIEVTTTSANSWVIASVAGKGADIGPYTPDANSEEQWDEDSGLTTFDDVSATGGYKETTSTGAYEWGTTATASDAWIIIGTELTAVPSVGTNALINIGDDWKAIDAAQINIGDTWKPVVGIQVNIGDVWKDVFP